MRPTWPQYALLLAKVAATRSEDPYVKVGACALRHDNSVASLGYNGAPPGVTIDWSDREERSARVIHAERNCLRYCKPGEVKLIVTTILPCSKCLVDISSYGVKEIYYEGVYTRDTGAIQLAKEFGIKLTQITANMPGNVILNAPPKLSWWRRLWSKLCK